MDEVKSRCTEGVLPDSWEEAADVIQGAAEKALGWSSGKKKDKETWWWSKEVQEAVKRKREAKKNWDLSKNEDSREEYKRTKKETKRKVARAKAASYRELYDNINGREGENWCTGSPSRGIGLAGMCSKCGPSRTTTGRC